MSVPKEVDPILELWVLFWYNHNKSHVNDIRENSIRIRLVRLFLYPFLKKEGVNEKEGTYNGTACFARN